jgi:hypothetical protein
MTNLPEVKAAIKQLSKDDIRRLTVWLQSYLDEIWDQQIEADFTSGKLDYLLSQAELDITAKKVQDLMKYLAE